MNQTMRRLAVPALVFVLALGLGGSAWWFMSDAMHSDAAGGIGGPFTLSDGAGRTVTDRDFRGRYMLVYFGYTFCPDVCPTTLNEVAGALEKLGPRAAQIQPLFITVDPRRDTAKVVADYVAAFSPRILGLTGTPAQIAEVARVYRVYYSAQRAGASGDYSVDHSNVLYLMDRSGRFVAPIRADQTAEQMAAEIGRHLS
jgi:cytochrome oxidase Cu insertion factor (SCO1/SenC/PrrC family)